MSLLSIPRLQNDWETYSRLGTTGNQGYPTRRRIVMVNQSAMVGAMITLIYAIFTTAYAPINFWPMLAASPVLVAGYLGIMWLNRHHYLLLARLLLLTVPSLQVGFAAWLFGNDAGVQLYFFVLWTAMFLLYDRAELWLSVIGGGTWISMFLWVHLNFDQPVVTIEAGENIQQLLLLVNALGAFTLVGVIVSLFYSQINRSEAMLDREYRRSEDLLKNILPASVAERLKNGSQTVADGFPEATLLFADIVGFTRLAEDLSPQAVVDLLNQVFSQFDKLVERHGLEKIKTIGDEYMLAGGIPLARADHAQAVAQAALQMLEVIQALNKEQDEPLALRVGIHTGEVVAGVIGSRKFSYDVWGDTVNIASRMQSQGLPGRIQVTEATYERLKDDFEFKRRGTLRVRGKGRMTTWFLTAAKPAHLASRPQTGTTDTQEQSS